MTVLASSLTGCATMQSTSGSSLYNPAQRVFLVRHAERFNDSRDDPPLTAEGKGRAKALADTPRDAGVSAIITSQWMRAKDTAQHLSGAAENCSRGNPYRRSTSGVFPGDGERVRRLGTDTVLVVGHIRIPNIIAELGDPQLSTICESVFSICSCWFRLWGGTASHGFVTALGRRFRRAAENSGDRGPDRN